MDDFPKLLKQYINENLKAIRHPSKLSEITFSDTNQLCDLLILFLNYEVQEPSLARIKDNFENGFQKIQDLNLKELPSAIESLATNFEPFLKKLALIKFIDRKYWDNDDVYCGINKTTFLDLTQGQFSFIDYTNAANNPVKKFPDIIIEYKSISRAILDFVRSSLRNAVHEAKNYSRAQIIEYSNHVLGIYLLAIRDNKYFLKKYLYHEYDYLERITTNRELLQSNTIYIDLSGKEEQLVLDSIAIEKMDGDKLMSLVENYSNVDKDSDEENVIDLPIARVDTITNIAKDTNTFIIIGEPGAGKTTCLNKLNFDYASEILNGVENSKFPVLIKASSYSVYDNFESLIEKSIPFQSIDEASEKYKLLILIDGINEIDEQYKISAYNELKRLISSNEDMSFIISTRKHKFNNIWNIPAFELKNLTLNQIETFIINISGKEKASKIWQDINTNSQILELSQNPLMLMMILQVVKLNNGYIPKNKGLLYKLFNEGILAREKKIYSTAIETKKDILAYLAFWMRNNGLYRKINRDKCKALLQTELLKIDSSIGVNNLIDELIDNRFLKNEGNELEFYHETQQEFFVALDLKKQFNSNGNFSFNYADERWFESLLICNDLFESAIERMNLFEYLFVGKKQQPKKLEEFTRIDVNENFIIACKIASRTKTIYPEIFDKAENYLNNYLIVWSYIKSVGGNLIDYEYIIQAVASLSSKSIFEKILFELKYNYLWFYDLKYENIIEDKTSYNYEMEQAMFNEKFEKYSMLFIENLSDFSVYYSLSDSKPNAIGFSSIKFNLIRLKHYTISRIPTIELISAFHKIRNKELLKEISKSDFDFLIENYQKVNDFDVNNLYEIIITFHLNNPKAISYLQSTLLVSIGNIKDKVHFFKQLILSPNMEKFILAEIERLSIDNSQEEELIKFYIPIRKMLKKIPISTLNKYSLQKYYATPTINYKEIKFKIIRQDSFNLIFSIPFSEVDTFTIKQNCINFLINDKYEKCEIEKNVHNKNRSVQVATLVKCNLGLRYADTIVSIKLLLVDIDFENPSNYHSDTFDNNNILKRYIESHIYTRLVKSFIVKVGIENSFLQYYESIAFSIILRVAYFENYISVVIYDNLTNSITKVISYFKEENIRYNDIVFIETNNRVRKLTFEAIQKIEFTKGVIIHFDGFKGEGFIKAVGVIRDFYFSVNSCNFYPSIGDEVAFLPGLNFYKKYNTKPTAYCISKSSNRIAVVSRFIEYTDAYTIFLTDKKTNEKYFSKVYKTDFELLKIEGSILINDEYKFVLSAKQVGINTKIRLIEKINSNSI